MNEFEYRKAIEACRLFALQQAEQETDEEQKEYFSQAAEVLEMLGVGD